MKIIKILIAVALFNQLAFSQVPSYVSTNGLVGYWPFNGNANDASGNGNNGTVNGATLATDRFGNSNSAYSFDGVDDFIETSNSFFNNGELDQSISVWFNPTSNTSTIGPGQTFFNTYPHNGFVFGYSYIGNQKIYFFKNSNPGIVSWNIAVNETYNTPAINLNSWHNAIIVKQGLVYKLYYNGNLVGTVNTTTAALQYMCKIRFGAITCCQLEVFNGKLDDIAIYNRALTQAEITALYNSTLSISSDTYNYSINIYPNPVVSTLNIKTDTNLINQPYSIIDNLGRVVLNGKLNEVESIINVEQLSKGIYYLKIAGNSATKFIKE
jgi:hypothetical protein